MPINPSHLSTQRSEERRQGRWRIRLRYHAGLSTPCDPCLFQRDLRPVVAQPVGVVQTDTGDHSQVGVENVDRVKSTAQSHLEYLYVDLMSVKDKQSCERCRLKISEADIAPRLLNGLECRHEVGVLNLSIINTDSLIKAQQMGRHVTSDTEPTVREDPRQHRYNATLAVGSGNSNRGGWRCQQPHSIGDCGNPIQPQINLRGVLRLQCVQPLAQRQPAHRWLGVASLCLDDFALEDRRRLAG